MRLDTTKTYLIDLDGTMYKGDVVIPAALRFIQRLQEHHIAYVFVTNNAMRTPAMMKEKMERMGFQNLSLDQFFTSAMAAASCIARISDKRTMYCIGEVGLQDALAKAGFQHHDEKVEYVFVGLDRQADYAMYCQALHYLYQGATLVGTNSDRRLPDKDTYLIGNGAILKMLEYASEANMIEIGKPQAIMMEETLRYLQKVKEDCIVIGDNLETDIAFGKRNGVTSCMVCSGVHTRADISRFLDQPDMVVDSLDELCI